MVNKISEINRLVKTDAKKFVLQVEEEYHNRIKKIAEEIKEKESVSIVLLAGPSAAGKTTSSNILCKYLGGMGIKTETLSLDDFYKTQEDMPRDEFGQLDFERVDSLYIEDIETCFKDLLEKGYTDAPIFNFKTKARESFTRKIELSTNGVVIVEGLHALNPVIIKNLPEQKIFKLYISIGSGFIDSKDEMILESRSIRLMRRMSRDIIYRNSPIERSLELWSSVIRGEDKYLCPYRPSAHRELKSFHDYEICLFKGILEDKLKALDETVPNFDSVKKIIAAMNEAIVLNKEIIPENSLLKEFMHG